jgi:hypothetical protein
MGSRGCRQVDSIEEFHEAAKSAIGFSRSGKAIVETFMDGPEFSVDAIVYKGEITICGLADRHIFFPPYFIEMGHTMPTVIDKERQDVMLETFRAGIRALGLNDKKNAGAAKGDIKLTTNGPMIGEIAARLSGGYMSGWTYPYSSGALPIKAAILITMGREPEGLIPAKNWTCAERAFISIPGTVKQLVINNEQKAEYINDFFLRVKEGDKVSFPENNVSKCGNVITSAEERDTAIAAAEIAAKSVLIRLDPKDRKTEEFLAEVHRTSGSECGDNKKTFPPDAFELTKELKYVLLQMEDTTNKEGRLTDCNSASLHLCESSLVITPFMEFISSGLKDYMGRTADEALEAVRQMTGLTLPVTSKNAENIIRLGRSFWAALIRGSYQGAVYYIDNLGINEKKQPT